MTIRGVARRHFHAAPKICLPPSHLTPPFDAPYVARGVHQYCTKVGLWPSHTVHTNTNTQKGKRTQLHEIIDCKTFNTSCWQRLKNKTVHITCIHNTHPNEHMFTYISIRIHSYIHKDWPHHLLRLSFNHFPPSWAQLQNVPERHQRKSHDYRRITFQCFSVFWQPQIRIQSLSASSPGSWR